MPVESLGSVRISLDLFLSGCGNQSLVCLQSGLLSHSIFHCSCKRFLMFLLMWLNGVRVFIGVWRFRAPSFARVSAISLPWCPAWALIQWN